MKYSTILNIRITVYSVLILYVIYVLTIGFTWNPFLDKVKSVKSEWYNSRCSYSIQTEKYLITLVYYKPVPYRISEKHALLFASDKQGKYWLVKDYILFMQLPDSLKVNPFVKL